jgi:hypothetical protein
MNESNNNPDQPTAPTEVPSDVPTPESDAAILPWIAHTQSACFSFPVVPHSKAASLERRLVEARRELARWTGADALTRDELADRFAKMQVGNYELIREVNDLRTQLTLADEMAEELERVNAALAKIVTEQPLAFGNSVANRIEYEVRNGLRSFLTRYRASRKKEGV